MNFKTLTLTAAALAVTLLTVRAQDAKLDSSKLPPAATTAGVTYAKDIKPILDHSCTKCHQGDKAKGKLHLDTLEGVVKGGKNGKAIIPGNSGQSPLVYAVAHIGDEDDFMPPPKNKANIGPLTPKEIGLIRAWVDQGAK